MPYKDAYTEDDLSAPDIELEEIIAFETGPYNSSRKVIVTVRISILLIIFVPLMLRVGFWSIAAALFAGALLLELICFIVEPGRPRVEGPPAYYYGTEPKYPPQT